MIDHQNEILQIEKEKIAYEAMQEELEANHWGAWVLVYGMKLIGTYESFHDAAEVAVERFGRGPYLIKQVGEGPITLPPVLLFKGL